MILSNSRELSSLAVHNVQLLPSLSKELLHCTSLQEIKISSCKGLIYFPETLQILCSLETFHVEDCDSVTSLPDISGLFSLKRLVIQKCKNFRGPPNGLNTCTSIETLVLSGCPNFEFFPTLARLCPNLFQLHSLIPRWLSSLSRLRSLDSGDLYRELNNFPDISPLPLSLRSLYIVGWPKIQSLPSQLQNLTHLERLALFCFDGVKTLPEWLCKLSSLQTLVIWKCENIMCLPPKDDIRRLEKLRLLNIKSFPFLKERCIKDGGAEWDKIAHIRRISMDDEDLQKPT